MSHGRGRAGLGTVLILAGVLTMSGALALALFGGPAVRLIVGGFVLGGVAVAAGVVIVSVSAQKQHRAAMEDACADLGLSHHRFEKKEDRSGPFAPFEHLEQLKTGAKGLAWLATGRPGTDAEGLTIFEHFYIVSTGQTTMRITHTIASRDCPKSWPSLSLTAEHFGHRLAGLFGKHDLRLESDAFNKRWYVRTDDEDFAALVLTPEMQSFLLDAPRYASVQIAGGRLLVVFKKQLKPELLRELTTMHAGVSVRVPTELQAWIPTA